MQSNLFLRIAANEPGAVEECLERFGKLIAAITRRYLFNRPEKDELVQEIFIQLWRHANRFDARVASEFAFVTMIAHRRSIDFRRKLQRSLSTISILEDLLEHSQNAERRIFSKEEAQWVRDQIILLPAIEREVIELAIDDEMSHAKIAERLGRPLGTIKTIARRGLRRLRDLHLASKRIA